LGKKDKNNARTEDKKRREVRKHQREWERRAHACSYNCPDTNTKNKSQLNHPKDDKTATTNDRNEKQP